jgi:hypothetical protein
LIPHSGMPDDKTRKNVSTNNHPLYADIEMNFAQSRKYGFRTINVFRFSQLCQVESL